ncbi:MAG: bacteriohemerythrin [Acidobacteriia bacterium]|nr:bacteriohemerythrin [Terriglobia bacterium]
MSLPFSRLIQWDPVYSVHVPSIDGQHRVLVSKIRELQEAMLEGRGGEVVRPLFAALNKYTKYHFEYEEQLLKKHGYAELEAHHQQHASLIAQLHELESKYAGGQLSAGAPVLQFLRTWLLDHIGEHDKQYSTFLRAQGVL